MKTLYQNITIPALKGDKLIKDSKLFSWIDPDFVNYGANEKTGKTNKIKVEIKELTENMTFAQMFDKNQALSQEQILYFIKNNKEKLQSDGYGTFFLFKSKNDFFVANVSMNSNGSLFVDVRRFESSLVWGAERRYRVVVPQLADTLNLENLANNHNRRNNKKANHKRFAKYMKNLESKFHYRIRKYLGKNDGRCEEEMMSTFISYRCRNKAKEKIDGASLCKTHANSLRKWRG